MGFFSALLGWSRPKKPTRVPTDEVIPSFLFDNTPGISDIILNWTLVFDDVLDADKLHDSLQRLLERPDWRKCGGRLRFDATGKIELHVPEKFTVARPAFRYKHVVYDMPLKDHPQARHLPAATSKISSQGLPEELSNFPETDITTRDELAYSDQPPLGLHVVSFADATVVGFSWPHYMTDTMGMQSLIKNWCRILAGREDEVEPLFSFSDDPLQKLVEAPEAEYQHPWSMQKHILTPFQMIFFGLRFLLDILLCPRAYARAVYFPTPVFAALRQRAVGDLSRGDGEGQPPFISDGDVVTAWISRLCCAGAPASSGRSVTIMNPFDIRTRVPSTGAFDLNRGAYLQYATFPTYALLPRGFVSTAPVGQIALRLREALLAQSSEAQAVALVKSEARRLRTGSTDPIPLAAKPGGLLLPFSSWAKAKLYETIDFSPAVIRAGRGENTIDRPNKSGQMSYFHSMTIKPSILLRNATLIVGKDASGGQWAVVGMSSKQWARAEKELEELRRWCDEKKLL